MRLLGVIRSGSSFTSGKPIAFQLGKFNSALGFHEMGRRVSRAVLAFPNDSKKFRKPFGKLGSFLGPTFQEARDPIEDETVWNGSFQGFARSIFAIFSWKLGGKMKKKCR